MTAADDVGARSTCRRQARPAPASWPCSNPSASVMDRDRPHAQGLRGPRSRGVGCPRWSLRQEPKLPMKVKRKLGELPPKLPPETRRLTAARCRTATTNCSGHCRSSGRASIVAQARQVVTIGTSGLLSAGARLQSVGQVRGCASRTGCSGSRTPSCRSQRRRRRSANASNAPSPAASRLASAQWA